MRTIHLTRDNVIFVRCYLFGIIGAAIFVISKNIEWYPQMALISVSSQLWWIWKVGRLFTNISTISRVLLDILPITLFLIILPFSILMNHFISRGGLELSSVMESDLGAITIFIGAFLFFVLNFAFSHSIVKLEREAGNRKYSVLHTFILAVYLPFSVRNLSQRVSSLERNEEHTPLPHLPQ